MFCVTRKTTHILCKSDKKPSEGESLEPPLPHCHRSITAQKLPYISLKFGLRLPVLPSSAPPGHLPPGEGRVGTEKPPAPKRGAGGDDGALVQHLAPAQAAHVGLGGLQPHEHVGLGLLPGPVQLGLGDAVLGRLPDHGQNGVQRLSLGLPPQGGVDAEVAGIVMAGAVRVDGVAKPLLLPHLLKLNHNPDETVDITWSALQYRLDESVGYPKIG